MAARLVDIVAQGQNMRQLGAVIAAMRGIAASRAQQGRAMLSGIDAYTEVVSRAIGEALALSPSHAGRVGDRRTPHRGLILFCAEQGFVGALSERVLEAAAPLSRYDSIFILGTRGIAMAAERGIGFAWSTAMATHTGAVPDVASRTADALYATISDRAISEVEIVFPEIAPSSEVEIARHSLLPLDFDRFAPTHPDEPPLVSLPPAVLVGQLAAEYVYARLCEAAMHAFAAENQARMIVMSAAKTNVESKLETLTQRERQLRQEEITTEILELASGAEAMRAGAG